MLSNQHIITFGPMLLNNSLRTWSILGERKLHLHTHIYNFLQYYSSCPGHCKISINKNHLWLVTSLLSTMLPQKGQFHRKRAAVLYTYWFRRYALVCLCGAKTYFVLFPLIIDPCHPDWRMTCPIILFLKIFEIGTYSLLLWEIIVGALVLPRLFVFTT